MDIQSMVKNLFEEMVENRVHKIAYEKMRQEFRRISNICIENDDKIDEFQFKKK